MKSGKGREKSHDLHLPSQLRGFNVTSHISRGCRACSRILLTLFGILRIPPFVNHKGNDVNSDWLADQWDERSVLGHAQFHKGRMKGDDPEIDTAQTPKRFDRRLALLGKTRKTFTDSIPNKTMEWLSSFCQRHIESRISAQRGTQYIFILGGKSKKSSGNPEKISWL